MWISALTHGVIALQALLLLLGCILQIALVFTSTLDWVTFYGVWEAPLIAGVIW